MLLLLFSPLLFDIGFTAYHYQPVSNATQSELIDKLLPLGRELYKTLETLPPGGGTKFVKDLQHYNVYLEQFVNTVKSNLINSKDAIDTFFKKSQPHIVTTEFDEGEMMDAWKWENQDMEAYSKVRRDTNGLWIHLEVLRNHIDVSDT